MNKINETKITKLFLLTSDSFKQFKHFLNSREQDAESLEINENIEKNLLKSKILNKNDKTTFTDIDESKQLIPIKKNEDQMKKDDFKSLDDYKLNKLSFSPIKVDKAVQTNVNEEISNLTPIKNKIEYFGDEDFFPAEEISFNNGNDAEKNRRLSYFVEPSYYENIPKLNKTSLHEDKLDNLDLDAEIEEFTNNLKEQGIDDFDSLKIRGMQDLNQSYVVVDFNNSTFVVSKPFKKSKKALEKRTRSKTKNLNMSQAPLSYLNAVKTYKDLRIKEKLSETAP